MTSAPQRIQLPPERTSIPSARHFVRAAVVDVLDGDALEVVELLVSELVTNAVLHGGTDFVVSVEVDGRTVRVGVTDASPDAPVMQASSDPLALSGRGLQFVEHLANRWGISPDGTGKQVWFEVAAGGP